MKMTRWCFSSAPSETSHSSNSPLKMKQPEVRVFVFLHPVPQLQQDHLWGSEHTMSERGSKPGLLNGTTWGGGNGASKRLKCTWVAVTQQTFPGMKHTTVQVLCARVSAPWSLWVWAVPCPRGLSVPLRPGTETGDADQIETMNVWEHWLFAGKTGFFQQIFIIVFCTCTFPTFVH